MTLNENWQNIGSANLTSNITIYLDGKLQSQSTADNSSTIQFRFRSGGYSWRTANGTATLTGEFTDSVGCATYPTYITDGDTIVTITKTITHDSSGNCNFNIGGILQAYVDDGTKTANISQVNVDLPHIERYATIVNSFDFTDELDPSMTFRNPTNYRINARLEFDGVSINHENISNTGTYFFQLNSTEWELLRQHCTGKEMTVRYVLATCYSGTTEGAWSYQDRKMTIVNGNPTFNITYEDSNATTIAITNDNQQIIQNNSTLQFNITDATAKKEATLSSISITINGITQTQPISSATLTFNWGTINVANNTTATVVLTDSRGFTTTKNVDIEVLSWTLPNAIITLNRKSNYYTETDINVDANYASLDNKNTITIQYRIKKTTDNTWGNWNNLSDNVTTTFNADNEYEWDVQVKVEDSLGTATYNLKLGIGIPIMFIDRTKRNVGIDCFPKDNNALEVNGNTEITGDLINKGINVLNTYTTTEQQIGLWLGKPLYRKVLSTTGQYGNDLQIAHSITDLKRVIHIDMSASNDLGTTYSINNTTFDLQINKIDGTYVYANVSSGFSSWGTIYYILEYTKTSDD